MILLTDLFEKDVFVNPYQVKYMLDARPREECVYIRFDSGVYLKVKECMGLIKEKLDKYYCGEE